MSGDPSLTKRERRDAARAARLESERAEAAAAQRRRRLTTLLAVLGVAAVVVVAAIVISGGGGGSANNRPAAAQKTSGAIPGQKESAAMLAGIPQNGIYLGKSNAPVQLIEFADLQCPICREYTLQTLPTLVQDYVRTGKVRMELRTLSFLGPDSVTAARASGAASQQNREWNFTDVFYYNQGQESSGYVTPSFLNTIFTAAGVDAAKANAFAATAAANDPRAAANTLAGRYGVDETPTILVGKRGGNLTAVNADATDVGAFKSAIDGVLGQA